MNKPQLICILALVLCSSGVFISTNAAADSSLAIRSLTNPDARELDQQNIAIGLFDAGIPSDTASHRQLRVFPEVRAVEARLLPFVLREILIESDQWGAVRVVPEKSPGESD